MFDNLLIEKTFENRGYSRVYMSRIVNYEHGELQRTQTFIERLYAAYRNREKVVILSDFDMDGISAGTLGYAGMAELGLDVALFLPNPKEGYGFNAATIDRLLSEYPDAKLIVTCDVGITSFDGVRAAKAAGIDVLLTDHHEPDEDKVRPGVPRLPSDTYCIVDPKCEDSLLGYKHSDICGAFVLYQLLESYAKRYCNRHMQEQIHRLRAFAGIGTISDSMPLLYENRKLVLDAISIAKLVYASGSDYVVKSMFGCEVYRRAFLGLHLVMKAFAEAGTIKDQSDITAELFAFYVAPMFNSVKRVGQAGDMAHAFGVFFGTDPEASISYLMNLNTERKTLVAQHYDSLLHSTQPYAPYIYVSDAPVGILGLLAQKLMDANDCTCCVVTDDKGDGSYHGSGRSLPWYPMRKRAIQKGFYVAGHNYAFGVGLSNNRELRRLYEFMSSDVESVRKTVDMSQYEWKPDFVIAHDGSGDTVIDIPLFVDYIHEIKAFEPFGSGFPSPSILLRFNAADGEWNLMGKLKQHLSVTLAYGFKVILFNQADLFELAGTNETVSVSGHLAINTYKDVQTVQFIGDAISCGRNAVYSGTAED